MQRVVVELRLPASLSQEAVRERAQDLARCGFQWDSSRAPLLRPAGRDELSMDNPTDRTVWLSGFSDPPRIPEIEAEPDVVAVWLEGVGEPSG